MAETINIATMSNEAVKALAYDRIILIQQAQAELNALSQELARRQQDTQQQSVSLDSLNKFMRVPQEPVSVPKRNSRRKAKCLG